MPVDRRVRAASVATALTLLVALFSVDYTVQPGDTLGIIARDNNVSVSDLVAANHIANPNLIRVGQVLVMPTKDQTHVVAPGESLYTIAKKYGTTVAALIKSNKLNNPNLIRPDQTLIIPGAAAGSGGGPGSSTGGSDSNGSTQKPDGASAGSRRYHIVKKGETLEQIAKAEGVTVEAIATANGITNHTIYTGTRLFLDGPGHVSQGTSESATYTVQRGDRLVDIANHYGTSVSKLASSNGISNVNLVRAGQSLKVPAAGAWVCPVEKASFYNDWGFPRDGGLRFHEGNDLFTEYAAPIRASVSGTVKFKTGVLGGLQFNLKGADGVEYIGSHLSAKETDGKVNAGDIIGYVGTSGNAQGAHPHLHFGMYMAGVPVNPYPTLIANGCK